MIGKGLGRGYLPPPGIVPTGYGLFLAIINHYQTTINHNSYGQTFLKPRERKVTAWNKSEDRHPDWRLWGRRCLPLGTH